MEPVGGEHGEIYKNTGLKHILSGLLGKPGLMLAAGIDPEIYVSRKVVHPDEKVQATIEFPQGTSKVEGDLTMRRIINAAGVVQPNAAVSHSFPVFYMGPEIDHLVVLVQAPQYPGAYELVYAPAASSSKPATTELFVQQV